MLNNQKIFVLNLKTKDFFFRYQHTNYRSLLNNLNKTNIISSKKKLSSPVM